MRKKKTEADQLIAKNYILEYYQAITDGSVTVGHWIREWYGQIVTGLQEKRFFFNQKRANMAIRFIQTFCRHHEGALAPGRIRLELWQKALLSVIFGCVDEDGFRQFREILIVMGRKNGKTLLAACIMALILYMDPDYGKRVYTVATKLDQARLSYEALYQMILKEPELADITKKRRTDIYIAETNSSAMPIAFSEKKTDGLNPSGAVCDELGAWQGEQGLRQYQVIKSALGARKQPMLVSITTAGYVSEGIYDEMIRRGTAVINGTSKETRLAPFLYMIDDADKWDDINEIAKANPNLGVSLTVDNMLEEIAAAEQSLAQAAEFKTKVCNLKQNSSTAWLTAKDVERCFSGGYEPGSLNRKTDPRVAALMDRESGGLAKPEDRRPNRLTLEDFRHSYALSGIDLSMTTDLTAVVILIQKGDTVWFFARFYMPKNKLEENTARDGIPYSKYVEQGYLILSGENVVDYHDVEAFYQELVRKYEILPQKNGYDRYSAAYLVKDLEGMGFHMESVSQGSNLTGVIVDTEGMIKDGRLKSAEDNNLMKIHMMDSALQMYEDNRRRLVKVSSTAHIDGMAALLDAMTMRRNYYTEMEHLLRNER